jgi:hypothetical protein
MTAIMIFVMSEISHYFFNGRRVIFLLSFLVSVRNLNFSLGSNLSNTVEFTALSSPKDLNFPRLEAESKINLTIASTIIEPAHVSVTMDLKSPNGEAKIQVESDLASRTTEATDFLVMDTESPKERFPPEVAGGGGIALSTEQSRQITNFDFNSVIILGIFCGSHCLPS